MTTRPRIAVIDYGAGNLVSIDQALDTVGAEVVLARDPEALRGADALLVPGVGAAAPAIGPAGIARSGRADPRLDRRRSPVPRICLGLQLLFEGSDEDDAHTFGVLAGRTTRLEDAPTLPHIGWNQVERTRPHPLFEGIADDADFYFVHSYAGAPGPAAGDDLVLATTRHGGRFTSVVARDPLLGVQFHPERSGDDGLLLLANFVEIVRAA